jgi:hypothetical protein
MDRLDAVDLVAQACGPLERELLRGLFHAPGEVVDQLGAASFQHLDRVRDVLPVVLDGDQPDARPRAALDLVLQTRTRAVRKERVGARAQEEQLLQQ